MEFIKFIFSSFWVFVGFGVIFCIILNFLFIVWNRFIRHFNIRKHGYPPPHCDADGDPTQFSNKN